MNASTLTDIVAVVVGIAGTIGIPLWNKHRAKAKEQDMTDVVSWKEIVKALQTEVARLRNQLRDSEHDYQKQLDDMATKHREQIKTLDDDWESRMATQQARVTQMENQITVLNQQLTNALRGGGSLS
jgi:type II secretory pathway pseudopilin PulG